MKKILVLAAVAMVAFASNAASFKWTAANIYGADGNKFAGEITLMAYAADTTSADAFVATTFTPTSAGAVSTTFNRDALIGGTVYNFFMVATQTVDGKEYTFTSPEKAGVQAQATSTPVVAFGNMQTASQATGAWAAVPEPTSGLLMLVGLAGLALRRRRA